MGDASIHTWCDNILSQVFGLLRESIDDEHGRTLSSEIRKKKKKDARHDCKKGGKRQLAWE